MPSSSLTMTSPGTCTVADHIADDVNHPGGPPVTAGPTEAAPVASASTPLSRP